MKTNLLSTLTRVSRTLLVAALAILTTGALKAQSGTNFFDNSITVGANTIDLGNASGGSPLHVGTHRNWAIFALSGGVTITDPAPGGPFDVIGNIALGGTGNLSMTASTAKASVYRTTITQTAPAPGSGFYTGALVTDPTYVTTGVSNATSAANAATAMPNTNLSVPMFTGALAGSIPSSISLTAAAAITGVAATTYVLNLNDLILSGSSAMLTLNGTSTTNYVINVNRFMTLSGGSKISLGAGGITEANILYNVGQNKLTPSSPAGTQYDVTLSGASEVRGIILAVTRNVKETGASAVYGEVIAKGVSLSGASKVINPYVSP